MRAILHRLIVVMVICALTIVSANIASAHAPLPGAISEVGIASIAPRQGEGITIKRIWIEARIGNEDKERACAFRVRLKRGDTEVYKREGWGHRELWFDGAVRKTWSDNLESRHIPLLGDYTFEVVIDRGIRCDIDTQWVIDIRGSDGRTYSYGPFSYYFENRIADYSFTFDATEYQ